MFTTDQLTEMFGMLNRTNKDLFAVAAWCERQGEDMSRCFEYIQDVTNQLAEALGRLTLSPEYCRGKKEEA